MNKLQKRLGKLTLEVLQLEDQTSEEAVSLNDKITVFQELAKSYKMLDNTSNADPKIRVRVDSLTNQVLEKGSGEDFHGESYIAELKTLQNLIKVWAGADGIEVHDEDYERNRKSSKEWDTGEGSLTTAIKLTEKQKEVLYLLDSGQFDKFLAVGGSGSGKSFVEAYYIIRDTLRHRAPCLIGRDKLVDLTQGMIDQIIPEILTLIAIENGMPKDGKWQNWTIDGLKFAKWTDKKTKLEFATGGYIRCAGLSARDLSESGSDKILSPSWLHIMLEEISELEYETIEKVITRLRYNIPDVNNIMLLCENPPSINHWSYRRFFEFKREDGSNIEEDERSQMYAILMNPQDNVENLGEKYIKNLSQMSGANRERFYLGQFQDTETGEVFKRISWVDELPRDFEWDKLVIYTDPTPLTGKQYSKWADYKASVLCGLFGDTTYVIDVRIVRGSTMDMLQNMKQLWDLSPDKDRTTVAMEKKQVPSDFAQVTKQYTAMTGWTIPIHMDTRHFGDKKASIETFLQPLFDNELIHFSKKFRDTERGRQTQVQILKFSRKANKLIHDDIPDAIMRADTFLKGRFGNKKQRPKSRVKFVTPAYVCKN